MTKPLRWVLGSVIVILSGALLIWAFLQGRKEAATEAERERSVKAPRRVSTENGETVITLDAATQARNDIEISTLKPATYREGRRANAVVLPVQDLTSLRNNYLMTAAEVEKTKAAVAVSQQEYERLKQLYQDNQNVSAKALQAAEGAWRSDQASLRVAQDSLALNESLARQTWGNTLANWLISGAPSFNRVLAQQELLLQVSLPQGSGADPPADASVQMPDGKIQPSRLVSAFPRVDPRIQSPAYLYIMPSRRGIAAGMTLLLLVAEGPVRRGVVIPYSAVVWWQGKAWAYVQTAPERFARREVPTDAPASSGWFVTPEFRPGDKVVTRGGQQLLSEEFRSQIQVLGEGDEGQEGEKD